ncbi:hypothetical protein CsSME_00026241 [Camellia sinensis var. sinensis]
MIKHDDEVDEEYAEGSFVISEHNFDRVAHRHPILVVNFYAPWCHWSNRLELAGNSPKGNGRKDVSQL